MPDNPVAPTMWQTLHDDSGLGLPAVSLTIASQLEREHLAAARVTKVLLRHGRGRVMRQRDEVTASRVGHPQIGSTQEKVFINAAPYPRLDEFNRYPPFIAHLFALGLTPSDSR